MLRSKSPFKKKSPKVDDGTELPPVTPQPHSLMHYGSVHEFQELQRQQNLLTGNAFAQRKDSLSRANSTVFNAEDGEPPATTLANVMEKIAAEDRQQQAAANESKTPNGKKSKKPAPLNLVPNTSTTKAVKSKRPSVDITEQHEDAPEHVPRPKSPGKKLFAKFFTRSHTSPDAPPKISPEWEETPEKAVKILGKESMNRKKGDKVAKKLAEEQEKAMSKLDFKCAGDTGKVRSRAGTLASQTPSTPTTPGFDAPTDRDIRSVGGYNRYPTRLPTTMVHRTVSDTATLQSISAAIDGAGTKPGRASDGYHTGPSRLHLQYMNDTIPPTPPSKDAREPRPYVTQVPAMNVKDVLSKGDQTPNTAFRIVSGKSATSSNLPPYANPHNGNEYLNLLLNHPNASTLRGTPSIRSAYGFIISPSTELANGNTFESPKPHFLESPLALRPACFPKSRDVSAESAESDASKTTKRSGHTRRWSDGSLAAAQWKNQMEQLAVPCLPPAFYSPHGYNAPPGTRDFTRPSMNDDPSLFYLPPAPKYNELQSTASSRATSHNQQTPLKASESPSVNSGSKNTTPVGEPRKFVVRKRHTSNIAAKAKSNGVGLGLSPLIDQTMHEVNQVVDGSRHSEQSSTTASSNAVPPPLSFADARRPSCESLPADEQLNTMLALHCHFDRNIMGLHNFVDHKVDQAADIVTRKNTEVTRHLHTSFNEVIKAINQLGARSDDMSSDVKTFKEAIDEKTTKLAAVLQDDVLNPMGELVETNKKLDTSVNLLINRIEELEKKQKEMHEAIASKAGQKHPQPNPTLPSMFPNPSPTAGGGMSGPSPHHSYPSQNFAAVSYPSAYGSTHSLAGPPAYPYYIPATHYPSPAQNPYSQTGWEVPVVDSSILKMSKEQRVQYLRQAGLGASAPPGTHPAYRTERNGSSGQEAETGGKDSSKHGA